MLHDFRSEIKLFLVVAAVSAVLAVAGILLLQAGVSNQVTHTPAPAPTPAPPPQPQALEGWQTYRNDEYEFEVKYPGDWSVRNFASAGVEISNNQTDSTFSIIQNNNPNNLSLDEWFREATLVDGRPTVKAAAERTMINGTPAYRIGAELSPPNPLFEIVAIADSHRNIFTIHARYEVAEDESTLEQVLSTFRFVE